MILTLDPVTSMNRAFEPTEKCFENIEPLSLNHFSADLEEEAAEQLPSFFDELVNKPAKDDLKDSCVPDSMPLSLDQFVLEQHKERRGANTPLSNDFQPSQHDVIMGRGQAMYNHIGNRRYRVLIAVNARRYRAAKTKQDKVNVIFGIIDAIREASPNGGFVKKSYKLDAWVEVGDDAAREKVGRALRDAYKESKALRDGKKEMVFCRSSKRSTQNDSEDEMCFRVLEQHLIRHCM